MIPKWAFCTKIVGGGDEKYDIGVLVVNYKYQFLFASFVKGRKKK